MSNKSLNDIDRIRRIKYTNQILKKHNWLFEDQLASKFALRFYDKDE